MSPISNAKENVVEIAVVYKVGETPVIARKPAVRGGAAMSHSAVMNAEHTADQGSPGGQARRIGAVVLIKTDTVPADPVHIGGGVAVVAVAAHMVRPQGVDIDEQNAHRNIPFSCVTCYFSEFTIADSIFQFKGDPRQSRNG